MRNRG